jgi:hypothetical protein
LAKPLFSLESFLDFAKSKPANETYDFINYHTCPAAQYCRFLGVDYGIAPTRDIEVCAGDLLNEGDWTWGALIGRVQAEINLRNARAL